MKATPLSDVSNTPPPTRPAEFANIWNRNRGPLARVIEFTDSRRKKVQTRMNQGISLEQFERAVEMCALTPFLRGDNDRGWKADFDWLIENDKNLLRVLEGKFDGSSRRSHESTRGAAVGRVERGLAAVRRAAAEQFGIDCVDFDGGPDDRLLPAPRDGERLVEAPGNSVTPTLRGIQ